MNKKKNLSTLAPTTGGRPPIEGRAMTVAERVARHRQRKQDESLIMIRALMRVLSADEVEATQSMAKRALRSLVRLRTADVATLKTCRVCLRELSLAEFPEGKRKCRACISVDGKARRGTLGTVLVCQRP